MLFCIFFSLTFYQEDFFSPEMFPDLANFKKLSLENFLKIRLNLALRLVKTHLLTKRVFLEFLGEFESFNTAFHFTFKDKFSFLTILFKTICFNSCRLKSLLIFLSFLVCFFIQKITIITKGIKI